MFTNGFDVTTGINISTIKYPKIIVNLGFNHFFSILDDINTFDFCISSKLWPIYTTHSSGHLRLIVIADEDAVVP